MIGPVEFDGLSVIVFDGEIQPFLFLDDTISKIDFVLFFKGKVLKQDIFSIGLSFDFELE